MRRLLNKRSAQISLVILCILLIIGVRATEIKHATTSIIPTTLKPTQTPKQVFGLQTTPTNMPTNKPIPPTQSQTINGQEAQVIKVVDGDTIQVSLNGQLQTVRIIGINTPETVDPRKPVECFGKEASNKAKELLSGQTVLLESDPSQTNLDKYQRLLRFVFLDNGTLDYGKRMIQDGFAYEYTYNYPYKYQTAYKIAQQQAQNEKKGLWADGVCENKPATQQASQNNPKATQTTIQTSTSGGDKDCKDFKTQAEAQSYFNAKGGSSSNNVDKLDGGDHDGVVCESLP